MQYVILQSTILFCQNMTASLCCVGINFCSFLLFVHSLLPLSLSFASCQFVLLSVLFSVFPTYATLQLFTSPFLAVFLLLSCHRLHLPPVSISPPGADPQLYGVPVLLPTWAERLFPPGPLPGANDRAVPGQRQPLPRQQQQVGKTSTTTNSDYESWWTVTTSRFQKFGLQSWLLYHIIWLHLYCKSFLLRFIKSWACSCGGAGSQMVIETGLRVWLSRTLGKQLKEDLEAEDVWIKPSWTTPWVSYFHQSLCWESLDIFDKPDRKMCFKSFPL